MNKNFYDNIRPLFGSLTSEQVQGIDAIIEECLSLRVSLEQSAYVLATAHGETGAKMQPRYENLNYSASRIPVVFSKARRQGLSASSLARNPRLLANTVYGGSWGAENLGNTQHGDGWKFRGRGLGQITGRNNYNKWSNRLEVDFVNDPEKLMGLEISVKALVQPMIEGWATGLGLSAFINDSKKDYVGARKVWNGTFEADRYAGYAVKYEAALIAGDYDSLLNTSPTKTVAEPSSSWVDIIAKFMKGFKK